MMKPKFVCTSMFSKCLELDFMWKKNIYEKKMFCKLKIFLISDFFKSVYVISAE